MSKGTTFLFAVISTLAIGASARAEVNRMPVYQDLTSNSKKEFLAVITNDRASGEAMVSALVNDNSELVGLDFATVQNGHELSGAQFSVSQIEQPEGIVLVQEQGIDAVILQGQLHGGEADMVLKFIYDAFSNEYHECKLKAIRGSDNVWFLQNAYTGQKVTRANAVTSSFGIQTIQGICP